MINLVETKPDMLVDTPYGGHAGYQRGSRTSLLAAKKATLTMKQLHKDILAIIREHGSMSADQIAQKMDMHFMRIRPRCTELILMGKLDKTGIHAKSALGNPQEILMLTEGTTHQWMEG